MKATKQFQFFNKNTKLQGYCWTVDVPAAQVIMVHGFGEHMNRYGHVISQLNGQQWNVWGADLRGHGSSEGKRGNAKAFDEFLEDVDLLIQKAREAHPGLPMLLYGHSMGGEIVTAYLLKKEPNNIKAALVTSPLFRVTAKVPKLRLAMGKFLLKLGINITEKANLDVAQLSRDPGVGKLYQEDPLVHGFVTASAFISIVDTGEWVLENAHTLSIPTLVAHGDDDGITDYNASKLFVERAGELATFKPWPGLRHETHNEINNQEVIQYYVDWMKQQIAF